MKNNKYLILRRIIQIGILFLFFSGANFGINILKGNLSTAIVLDKFHLSDPYAVLQMLFTGYIPTVEIITGAVIILVFYSLLGGRIFCSWVCPLNIITDFASYVRKKIGIKPALKIKTVSRNIRYYVVILGLLLSFITGIASFELINPISIFFRGLIFGSIFSLSAVLIIFLFDLFIVEHGWCGHICPVGAVYSVTGKFRLLNIYHTYENCTLCMKCKRVCPEIQVLEIIGKETGKIKSSECTDCGRCIDVCDDNALKFKLKM
ncbi:MAG: quinol dehydrogenase ferredoxin subunit NapH [Chlorobi bacterium]|nr:quinol dehydrogenase ferredoxin subunit NapH [Chlorobiota bacterium]